MAKKSVEHRNWQRKKLVDNTDRQETRNALRDKVKEGDYDAMIKLQKRTRNESATRVTRRCESCGRPRGTYRKFSLCRICLRKYAVRGFIPGLKKASW